MSLQAKILWHTSREYSSLKVDTLSLNPNEVVIKSLYSLISLGTEKLVATGNIPFHVKEAMRVPYMQGDFDFPLTYGYSVVGKVIEGPNELKDKVIHMLHPHQSLITANPNAITLLPTGIPARRATLASNMETAVNAIWDSGISIGDRVLIVGFGLIGALIGQVLKKIAGVELLFIESNGSRQRLANDLGFDCRSNQKETKNHFDVAVNTSGHENGLQLCIDAVGLEGKIIELSWYGNKNVNINLGGDFHHMRKRIISSQVSSIPMHKSANWNFKRRKSLVMELLKDKSFDNLITNEVAFDTTPLFFDKLRNQKIDHLSTVIKY